MAVSTIKAIDIRIVNNVSLGSFTSDTERTVDVSAKIPNGYKLASVIPRFSGGNNWVFTLLTRESDTEVKCRMHALTSATTANVSVDLICVRQ